MVHPILYFQLLTSDQSSANFGLSFDSCLIILVKTDSCPFPSKCARHLENFRMVKYYSICNRSYTRSVWDTMHNVLHKDMILYQSFAIIFYHSKIFQRIQREKGQESFLTKIIKQLLKDDPKLVEDWLLVSSWKYDTGWSISTLLQIRFY